MLKIGDKQVILTNTNTFMRNVNVNLMIMKILIYRLSLNTN
jgi:hypothetical protein